MLYYRCGAMRGVTPHCVSTWWCLAEHYRRRSAYLSALSHSHVARRVSTSYIISSSETNKAEGRNIRIREPHLRRLAVVRPDLVDEWVPELNDADVGSLPSNSQLTVWWRCAMCGENFQATVRDRAVADKGCPHCALTQQRPQHMLSSDGSVVVESVEPREGAPSLAETHPELSSRWDHEKNGLLRPTDVTSTSELSVWWKPAKGREGHERSFRRPVYAFVEMPYSAEEQKEAQAALELDILRQVRQAAKVAEARELGLFPEDAAILDDIVLNNHNNKGAATVSASRREQQEDLVGEDLHKAIENWEHNFDVKSDPTHGQLFQFTEVCELAEVSRNQVLTTYSRFVMGHKEQKEAEKSVNTDSNTSTDISVFSSAITDPDWVQHFTLSVEDISKDRFGSSARLVLPDFDTFTKQQSQYEKKGKEGDADGTQTVLRRVDTLPPPPEEYEDEVHTMFAQPKRPYPRRPPMPPSREDDLTETIPKATGTSHECTLQSQSETGREKRGRSSKGGVPVEAAFDVLSLASSQSLSEEYTSNLEKNVLFDANEQDLNQRTLLGPAALQSMTNEQAQSLQYNRGTPRPRRTGRFRLRPPEDADFKKRGSLTSTLGSIAYSTTNLSQEEQPPREELEHIIQAPGTPRKVARPKKKLKEILE